MNIKNLANDMIFKLIAGIVLAGAMVLAMVYFASAFHDYLNEFTHARTLELISFGAIFIGATVAIYFLLRDNNVQKNNPPKFDLQNFPLSVDLQMLAFKFFEGFIEGALKPKDASNLKTEKKSSDQHSNY